MMKKTNTSNIKLLENTQIPDFANKVKEQLEEWDEFVRNLKDPNWQKVLSGLRFGGKTPDGSYDLMGSLNINSPTINIKNIPIKINKLFGDVLITHSPFGDLTNLPKIITGELRAAGKINSLKGHVREVGGNLDMDGSKISTLNSDIKSIGSYIEANYSILVSLNHDFEIRGKHWGGSKIHGPENIQDIGFNKSYEKRLERYLKFLDSQDKEFFQSELDFLRRHSEKEVIKYIIDNTKHEVNKNVKDVIDDASQKDTLGIW